MSDLLKNYLGGRWVAGSGAGTALFDPVLGDELVRVDATGLDLRAGFAFARESGGAALRAMTYRERAAMLAAAVKVLQARRDDYYAIATANSGTVKNDSAVDIDGGIYTLSTYAKLGESLGERRFLLEGRTKSGPVDDMRPHQRRYQRQNEGNRHAEQRILHRPPPATARDAA